MKVKKEYWDDRSSNQEQQYLTHGAFRYFGKLPPTLTRKILSSIDLGSERNKGYVELMCGSGTGILEAMLLGATATGVDCNPLALLATKVKTTRLNGHLLEEIGQRFAMARRDKLLVPGEPPRTIRNLNKWFTPEAQRGLSGIRDWISRQKEGAGKDVLRLAFASSIRACSNASVRTGRLFHDRDKVPPAPDQEFEKRLVKLCGIVRTLGELPARALDQPSLIRADARKTTLPSESFTAGLCHPPYFALYRYSSDVLRFELDWLGLSRSDVAQAEIEDGFKTTDARLVEHYVADLGSVLNEARRLIVKGGRFVVVTADSTLRKERLSIIQPLIENAVKSGWTLERHVIRKVYFAQASYHRSADPDIQRPEDEVLFFRAS